MSVTSACPIKYNTLLCHRCKKLSPVDLPRVPDVLLRHHKGEPSVFAQKQDISSTVMVQRLQTTVILQNFFFLILVLGSRYCDENSDEPK